MDNALWHTDTVPKLHHATSLPITLRIGRVAHALAADAAEIDGRSVNNELLHLIELGLGVRAKQEIVRKAMTRDPKPPPIRMRVNPHDPYSPIARLPGQTYPGDPLVKRPRAPQARATGRATEPAGRATAPGPRRSPTSRTLPPVVIEDDRADRDDDRGDDRDAPSIRTLAEQVRDPAFVPPTAEELAALGDELDDVAEELADLEARHPEAGSDDRRMGEMTREMASLVDTLLGQWPYIPPGLRE